MSLDSKSFPATFDSVKIIKFGDWPQDWLAESDDGDLLLGPEDPEATFGILCIYNTGVFLVLNAGQLYRQEPIPWPDTNVDGIKEAVIYGNRVEYY